MKLKDVVLIVILVVVLLLALAYFFKPKAGDETDPGNNTPGNGDPGTPGAIPCQKVPGNFPPFQNAATPPGAKAFLGVTDAEWTSEFEARLRGFFLAVDVEPTEYAMKYFGSKLIWQYLNSQDGQLPDLIVLKGSKRCGTVIATNSDDLPKPAFCINPFLTFDDENRFSYIDVDGKRTPESFVDDIAWNRAAIKGSFGGGRYEQHFVYNEQIADRIIGFFKATNLKITARSVLATLRKFPGQKDKNLIVEYLNSGYGGLSFNMIEKGSMRCDSGQNVINYL